MASSLLHLSKIVLVPSFSISAQTPDADILGIAVSLSPENAVPGTAALASELKQTAAGPVWSHEVVWQYSGMIQFSMSQRIYRAGAIVMHTQEGQVLVLHKNDVMQNTPLRPTINAGLLRSQVMVSASTLNPLI